MHFASFFVLAVASSQVIPGTFFATKFLHKIRNQALSNRDDTLPSYYTGDNLTHYYSGGDASVPNKYGYEDNLFESVSDVTSTDDYFALDSGVTWADVLSKLQSLNAKGKHVYKLFFLARHGEGWHNVVPDYYSDTDWTCKYQMLDGGEINGTYYEWADAELTPKGMDQIKALSTSWAHQINDLGTPVPKSFYVSPLRRTLQTFDLTWSSLIDYSQTKPVVKELARENYGIATSSQRHPEDYISQNWPFVTFETKFTSDDILWSPTEEEKSKHRKLRANILLNDIFTTDSNDIISLTSHSGLINSIMDLIGQDSDTLNTGGMVPVIIKASNYGTYEWPDIKTPFKTLPDSCSS